MKLAAAIPAAALIALSGCSDRGPAETTSDNPALSAPVPAGMVRGTVLETMNSGGYTYVLLETDRDTRWAAARETAVSVGDVVQVSEGMAMTNFQSRTLNRTFELVYFVDAIQNLSAPAAPEGTTTTAVPGSQPDAAAPAEIDASVLVAALEPGKDIAYVYANRETLAGAPVSLRGKVVKYNENILGWNFIHIQDGSGDAADGSNDLIVTSKTPTAVGETIVVAGNIVLDKDFGAGYSYPVLLEDASITAE